MRAPPRTARLAVLLGCWTAFAGLVAASPVGGSVAPDPGVQRGVAQRWSHAIELPLGSRLELATGRVLDASTRAEGPSLELVPAKAKVADPLRETTSLRFASTSRVLLWRPGGLRPEAPRIERPSVGAPSGAERSALAIGAEFVVLPDSARDGDADWAYVRVLDVASRSVRLEVATAPHDAPALQRDPVALTADAEPVGHRLRWSTAAPAEDDAPARYAVHRRTVGPMRADSEGAKAAVSPVAAKEDPSRIESEPAEFGPWRPIALVEGTTYLDDDAPAWRLVEYAVVRVDADGRPVPGTIGDAVRSVRVETPGEWALDVGLGARIDLITGRLAEPGSPVHIEIGRSVPGSLAVKPLDETRLALTTKLARDPEAKDWWIPAADDRRFIPGRTGVLQDGGAIEFRLPGQVTGRLYAEHLGGDRWRLRRQVGLDGERLLPQPPVGRPVVKVDPAGGRVVLDHGDIDPAIGVDPDVVALVLEREIVYGSGDWAALAESPPGIRRLECDGAFARSATDPLSGEAPVARLRVRQRLAFGASSHAARPFDVIAGGADPNRRKEALEDALVGLDDDSFQRRIEARGVLLHLGEEARPALESIAIGDLGPRGIAARAVLEAIEAGDASGRGAARRMRRAALEIARTLPLNADLDADAIDAWLGDVPPALVHGGPADRAHGLLVLVDRAERGVLASRPASETPESGSAVGDVNEDCRRALVWARVCATSDDDPGVRQIAEFLGELEPTPSLASFDPAAPAYLVDRDSIPRVDLLPGSSWLDLPASAEELAWQLEERPELGDLDLGPPLARLLDALRAATRATRRGDLTGDDRYFDYDARTAELALRLVERARDGDGRRALLDAASALFPGEDRELAARREVSDRRLASPSADAVVRRTVVVDAPDLDLLAVTIDDIAGDGDLANGGTPALVDVLLAPGVYEDPNDSVSRTIDLVRSGVRLRSAVPGERVEIRASLRVRGARDVVLEDVEIRADGGSALTVMEGGHAIALRSRLAGAGSAVYLQDADLELVECVVDGADLVKPPQWAVREMGESRLFARATRFDAGTLFLSDESRNWLDRCVVDAGQRTLVQSQRAGHLVARESLLRGTNLGLYNVERGVLAAVVIDAARDPLGRRPSRLRVSPRLFHLVGDGQRVPTAMKLQVEPLQRPR